MYKSSSLRIVFVLILLNQIFSVCEINKEQEVTIGNCLFHSILEKCTDNEGLTWRVLFKTEGEQLHSAYANSVADAVHGVMEVWKAKYPGCLKGNDNRTDPELRYLLSNMPDIPLTGTAMMPIGPGTPMRRNNGEKCYVRIKVLGICVYCCNDGIN
jgi:hypothetical protein